MRIRLLCAALSGALLLSLCACANTVPDTQTEETTTTHLTITTAAIVEKDLASILTQEVVSDALGVAMNQPTVSNQGTTLTSIAEEGKTVLSVEVSEKPIEIFNAMLQSCGTLTACPNLGESAWYSPLYNQLYVYGNGYMISVELTGLQEEDADRPLLRSRQIAALLLEQL